MFLVKLDIAQHHFCHPVRNSCHSEQSEESPKAKPFALFRHPRA